MSRRCQSDEDWHQVSCHSFPCQRRFCRRRRRRSGGGCCCGRLPQSACVLFQSPSQSIIHCDRARRREGEREAAGRREREAAGRREADSRERRRERAERSWGSAGRARSEAARGEARPGEEATRSAGPTRSRTGPVRSSAAAASSRSAPLGPGAGCALSAVENSRAADSESSGPRAWNGQAGSRAPGACPDLSLGTSASARIPARPAPGWALRGARLGTAGRLRVLLSRALGVLWLAFTRSYQPRAAFECLEAGAALAWGRVAGVKQRRQRPSGPGEAGRAEVCRRTSAGTREHAGGGGGRSEKPGLEGRRSSTLTASRGRIL